MSMVAPYGQFNRLLGWLKKLALDIAPLILLLFIFQFLQYYKFDPPNYTYIHI